MKKNPKRIGREMRGREVPRVKRPVDNQDDDQNEDAAQNFDGSLLAQILAFPAR
jgi:hypothetical protein